MLSSHPLFETLTALGQRYQESEAKKLNDTLVNARGNKQQLVADLIKLNSAALYDSIANLPLTLDQHTEYNTNFPLSVEELIIKLGLFLEIEEGKITDCELNNSILYYVMEIFKRYEIPNPQLFDKLKNSIKNKMNQPDYLITFYRIAFGKTRELVPSFVEITFDDFMRKLASRQQGSTSQPSTSQADTPHPSMHTANQFFEILKNKKLTSSKLEKEWRELDESLISSISTLEITRPVLRTQLENDDIVSVEEIILLIAARFKTTKVASGEFKYDSISIHNTRYIYILDKITKNLSKNKGKLQQLCNSVTKKLGDNELCPYVATLFTMRAKHNIYQSRFNLLINYLHNRIQKLEPPARNAPATPDLNEDLEVEPLLTQVLEAPLNSSSLLHGFFEHVKHYKYAEVVKYLATYGDEIFINLNNIPLLSASEFDKNNLTSVEQLCLTILLIPANKYKGKEFKNLLLQFIFNNLKTQKLDLKSKLIQDLVLDNSALISYNQSINGDELSHCRLSNLINLVIKFAEAQETHDSNFISLDNAPIHTSTSTQQNTSNRIEVSSTALEEISGLEIAQPLPLSEEVRDLRSTPLQELFELIKNNKCTDAKKYITEHKNSLFQILNIIPLLSTSTFDKNHLNSVEQLCLTILLMPLRIYMAKEFKEYSLNFIFSCIEAQKTNLKSRLINALNPGTPEHNILLNYNNELYGTTKLLRPRCENLITLLNRLINESQDDLSSSTATVSEQQHDTSISDAIAEVLELHTITDTENPEHVMVPDEMPITDAMPMPEPMTLHSSASSAPADLQSFNSYSPCYFQPAPANSADNSLMISAEDTPNPEDWIQPDFSTRTL